MWLVSDLLSILGFLLAVLLLSRLLKERRAPANTVAWLLAIALVPYVGVPLYLILGGRKIKRMAARKGNLYAPAACPAPPTASHPIERILYSAGTPGAVEGNRVELLPTGETAYDRLVEMLDGAERSIHVATFILGGDEVGNAILDRLERKAGAGIEVRLLIDSLYSYRTDRRRLRSLARAGGKTAFFMPVLHIPFRGHANLRNHRKIVVVDGRHGMVGGMNLAREYMGPTEFQGRWCDVSMRVDGPAVAALATIFRSDWSFAAGEVLAPDAAAPNPFGPGGDGIIQVVPSGPDVSTDTIYDAILAGLFEARERIWIATPYFVPDEPLARALVLAVRRGVDVRILLPSRSNHWTADIAGASYLREIQDVGGRVFRYRAGMMHAKVIVIDELIGVLGSANMDLRSLFLNYEMSLLFYSKPEIEILDGWFRSIFPACEVGLPEPGRLRGHAEDLGRLLAPLL